MTRDAEPWPIPSGRPTLAPGIVHIWKLDLDLEESVLVRLAELLSASERDRARRFRHPTQQCRFVAARGQLRVLLGRYRDCPPERLAFTYGPQGKPALHDPAELSFNLSHSGTYGLLAVTCGAPVGIDLEAIRPLANFEAIARRFFAPEEVEALAAVPATERLAAFFRCWTRKEAVVKANGAGLACPLDQFVVTLASDQPARLLSLDGSPTAAARWSLIHLDPAPGYLGCLALPRVVNDVRRWSLRGETAALLGAPPTTASPPEDGPADR